MKTLRRTGIAVFIAVGAALSLTGCSGQIAFDRKVWLANPQPQPSDNPRSRMLVDLENRYIKPGMSRQRVRALLGQPDAQSEYDKQHNDDVYDLGSIGPFGIDPSILKLHYDASGKLTQIEAGET